MIQISIDPALGAEAVYRHESGTRSDSEDRATGVGPA